MSTEQPSKKARLTSALEWKVTFDQTQGLRTLVEVVCNILTRVNFRITYDEKREMYFLCIDSIDPQHVCMIQARLLCENTTNITTDVDFCVDSQILNLILKSVPSHYSIDLAKYSSSADVTIKAYETLSNSHHTVFELPTLVDDSETMQLTDMAYEYTIEIDLGTLRQIVKMSMQLHAEKLEFMVKEPSREGPATKDILRTTFTIASRGNAVQSHNFHSATISDGETTDTCIIRAVTDSTAPDCDDDVDVVYNDSFSAQYLNFFLKSMERQIITMKLSQDKPLILHYPLGADKSYICFVLAPKTAE